MLKKSIWNISRSDGSYLGQAESFAPHTAFCEYMSLSNNDIEDDQVVFEAIDDRSGRITFQDEQFIVTKQDLNGHVRRDHIAGSA